MFDYKEYNRIMYLRNQEFKKELDLKNSLYVPTEADIRLMHENLLITKPKDEE